jgi:hypothetical protein
MIEWRRLSKLHASSKSAHIESVDLDVSESLVRSASSVDSWVLGFAGVRPLRRGGGGTERQRVRK